MSTLERLLGGVTIPGDKITHAQALAIVSSYFASKFNGRAPTKPIDLLNLFDARGHIEAQLVDNLTAGLDEPADVLAALETIHKHALPKMGLGTLSLHERCGAESQPLKVAYEHGCRLFPFVDPVGGPFAKINPVEKYGEDLRGLDLSDAVITSAVNPFRPANLTREDAKGLVRRSFDELKEKLGPLNVPEGEPLLDGYMLIFPTPLIGMPKKEPLVDVMTLTEAWREMEALVDAGLVRTLGVSNFTTHQLDALLRVARHRPAFLQQERHPLNHIDEFMAFCDARKLAVIAPVPLATGEILDSKHLVHDQMTPAQAALHWNIVSGVSVIPGADTIAQVIENCATMSKLHLKPITPPEPPNPLRKIYPVWPGMHDLFCETGTSADAGIFVTDENGRGLVCAKAESKVAANAIMAAPLTDAEQALLSEVRTAVSAIPIYASAVERRAKIDAAVKGMSPPPQEPQEPQPPQQTPQPQQQSGGEMDLVMPPVVDVADAAAAGAHSFAPRAAGNLTRMVVVPFSAFLEAGAIPRRSVKNAKHAHVSVDEIGPDGRVLFFSQRWLTPCGDPASPDDATGAKYISVVAATKAWAALNGHVPVEKIYIWIDYACVEQDDVPELTRGVNSLGLYVCSTDAFITIEHESYFDRGWCLLECLYADTSKVPRFLMTAKGELRPMVAEDRVGLKRPHQGSFTVETDRSFMRNLESVAQFICSQLERGVVDLENMSPNKYDTGRRAGFPSKPVQGPVATLEESVQAVN